MKYIVRRFYSGFCTYNVEADNKDQAHEMTKGMPITDDMLGTLENWEECDEAELGE